MASTGYIYFWRAGGESGRIRVCNGDFAQLNVAFHLADCDPALQSLLVGTSINRSRQCPPPPDSIQTSFDFDVRDGELVAVNVT